LCRLIGTCRSDEYERRRKTRIETRVVEVLQTVRDRLIVKPSENSVERQRRRTNCDCCALPTRGLWEAICPSTFSSSHVTLLPLFLFPNHTAMPGIYGTEDTSASEKVLRLRSVDCQTFGDLSANPQHTQSTGLSGRRRRREFVPVLFLGPPSNLPAVALRITRGVEDRGSARNGLSEQCHSDAPTSPPEILTSLRLTVLENGPPVVSQIMVHVVHEASGPKRYL